MEVFAKTVNGFQFLTIFPKSSISDVWQGFEFAFVAIIFAKVLANCLLNLINIYQALQYSGA